MKNKKILFVITGLGLGGAEKQICLLADKLNDNQHQIKIVSLGNCSENKVLPTSKSIDVINIDMKKSIIGLIHGVINLRNIIKEYAPEVVHGHMFHANIVSRLALLWKNKEITVISTAHNKNEGGKLRMLAYRLTDFLCHTSTNVSKEALEEFIRLKAFNRSKSRTIYNGIDIDKFRYNSLSRQVIRSELDLKEGEVLLLAVGRLTAAKDYPNLLNALCLLPQEYKLAIIGDGDLRIEINELIARLNLQNRVTLLGVKEDVTPYYSACDIFVLSSLWEGFGLVVAEAMSCERLVIGTNSGGVREVIGDDNFLVPVSDSVQLARRIEILFSNSVEVKDEITSRNREYIVQHFSISSAIEQWQEVYRLPKELK